jgi:hypothetical protein
VAADLNDGRARTLDTYSVLSIVIEAFAKFLERLRQLFKYIREMLVVERMVTGLVQELVGCPHS